MAPVISFLSDFGLQDHYVGVVKAVIATLAPDARVIDIAHQVAPGNVLGGAYLLKASCNYFPRGTVHLAVIDPGVGSPRRILAVESQGAFFVAPDNGLLSYILAGDPLASVIAVDPAQAGLSSISNTFHGRDIMAPVAAGLASGVSLQSFGAEAQEPILLDEIHARRTPEGWQGQVIHIDRFGNCITNIQEQHFKDTSNVLIAAAGRVVRGLVSTYASGGGSEPLALIGSAGHLEIALQGASASEKLGLTVGSPVTVS